LKILVTGANGFVGRVLCPLLEQSGYQVTRVVRNAVASEEKSVGKITETTNWSFALEDGVDAVVHLAAKVPLSSAVAGSSANETLEEYCRVNAWSTENFARQCAAKGVKRFVFISTVKILGEGASQPYQADDLAIPCDAYAISKWEAEQLLQQIGSASGMEVVILRPPLVYGPGVQGNFLKMLDAVYRRRPLPFGLVRNRRSLIYVDNLADAIRVCLTHPAANKTWMVSDAEDVSTPDLIRDLAATLQRSTLLLPVPVSLMIWAGKLLGKGDMVSRLVGSLSVDSLPIRTTLSWSPPYSLKSGLKKTVEWYLHQGVRQ
jgi:UDP-glucose 4-epimerase